MQWLEREIELAHNERVSHPDNLPFYLSPENSNGKAVLLIHGFSASPREMRPLGTILQRHNYTVYGVRLPGHGTTPQDLANRRAEEWLETVERGYQSLVQMNFNVNVAGLSTGALLSLHLALKQHPEKMILLSPFLQFQHLLAPFAGLLSHLVPYQDKEVSKAERLFYYQRRPLKGIAQINRLLKQLNGKLESIMTPTLIITSTGDATIAKGTAAKIYQQLASNEKQFHCYGNEVPHVLTTTENPQQQDVLQRCVDFLAPPATTKT